MQKFLPVISIFICILSTTAVKAQRNDDSPLYIEVLIDSQGRIYAQNDRIPGNMLTAWVNNYINSQPAFLFDKVVYRVYGDKNSSSGAISDVVSRLLMGYDYQVQVEKYLLDFEELNLDGQNYIKKLNELDWQ